MSLSPGDIEIWGHWLRTVVSLWQVSYRRAMSFSIHDACERDMRKRMPSIENPVFSSLPQSLAGHQVPRVLLYNDASSSFLYIFYTVE